MVSLLSGTFCPCAIGGWHKAHIHCHQLRPSFISFPRTRIPIHLFAGGRFCLAFFCQQQLLPVGPGVVVVYGNIEIIFFPPTVCICHLGSESWTSFLPCSGPTFMSFIHHASLTWPTRICRSLFLCAAVNEGWDDYNRSAPPLLTSTFYIIQILILRHANRYQKKKKTPSRQSIRGGLPLVYLPDTYSFADALARQFRRLSSYILCVKFQGHFASSNLTSAIVVRRLSNKVHQLDHLPSSSSLIRTTSFFDVLIQFFHLLRHLLLVLSSGMLIKSWPHKDLYSSYPYTLPHSFPLWFKLPPQPL